MHASRLSPLVFDGQFVYGWAFRDGQPSLPVHLYVDGRHVASEMTGAQLPRSIIRRCEPLPDVRAGFVFAMPGQVLDGFEHRLHVGLPNAPGYEGMHGKTVAFKSGSCRGEVRQQSRQFVGTVWFDKLPARPPELVVEGDGAVLCRQSLGVSPVAEPQGYPAPFSIEREDWPEGLLHFRVNGQELRGSPCRRRTQLVGMVEEISEVVVRGWAFDGADARRPIELLLRIDGHDAAWFRPNVRRPEIARQVGIDEEGWGLVGFEAAMPESLRDGEPHRVEVVLAETGQLVAKGQQTVTFAPVGVRWNPAVVPAHVPVSPVPAIPAFAAIARKKPVVSAVVLSRNGAALLDAFLRSWQEHLTTVSAEIIVVDHGSTDDSVNVLREWQERLPLQIIALDHNGSFSASSNLGARQAQGDYLLFVNNDIVWVQDVLPRLLECLQDPNVGIAGLKLLKIVGESRDGSQHAHEVQHLGVRFKLNDRGYWPYEASPSLRHREAEHSPQHVPVVTGAVMMCRREDFERVGGFDPDYFYGFEDVELCLRLAYRLGKSVVCRNDCLALHHHGHTRLSGRQMSIYDRVQRNSAVLQGHIGLWIKQAYWRSLLQGDGYITSEPMVFGIVVDADPETGKTPLTKAALALAGQLAAAHANAEILLLDPTRDWKKVAGVHVLIVGDTRYDVRSLRAARADLLTVAWLHGDTSEWEGLPWWRDFHACLQAPRAIGKARDTQGSPLVYRPSPGRPMGELLSVTALRLRVAIHSGPANAVRAAELQEALQSAGLPCWLVGEAEWGSHPVMADICVTLWGAASGKGVRPSMRSDVLNVLWLVDGKARLPAEAKGARCLVLRTMPKAAELAQEMERRVGSTFSPP